MVIDGLDFIEPRLKAGEVVGQARHAVRVDSPQAGLHQRAGDSFSIRRIDPDRFQTSAGPGMNLCMGQAPNRQRVARHQLPG